MIVEGHLIQSVQSHHYLKVASFHMINRNMNLEDDQLINHAVFHRVKDIEWRAVSLDVDFGGGKMGFVGDDLVGDGKGKSLRECWDDDLKGAELEGGQISEVSEVKTDVDSGLNGVLVEVELEFLHGSEIRMDHAWTKIKNCFLIIHELIKCII